MEIIFTLLIVVLLVRWLVIRDRFRNLEQRIEMAHSSFVTDAQFAQLIRRVAALERAAAPSPQPSEAPRPSEAPQPAEAPPETPVASPAQVIPEPVPAPPPPQPAPPSLAAALAESEPSVPAEPESTWSDRLRSALGSEEWEALVGGSLLNKAGALVLVIGIALFLAYSFGHMSPAGRTAVAFVTSSLILGAGVWIERRAAYRVFARGLIGAGWAALYATSYAAYALPAARIIENPFIGSIGMLLVAVGMIGHSLRYRNQAITGIAYFAAFAALAVTPSTPFAVLSLVPLAASLLYLADRFDWHAIALYGMAATWGTCISRGSSDSTLLSTQALFLTYWLLFEGFDLLRVRKRLGAGALQWIAPLNAGAFLRLSFMAWSHHAPDLLWLASACAAGLYLASAIARAFLRPPSTFSSEDDLLARVRAGSYESSVGLAAILGALAIVARVPGVWTSVGLALEAQALYLAGVRLRARFIERCGRVAFVFSLGRLVSDNWTPAQTRVFGVSIYHWTPPALLHAFLFYGNRMLRPSLLFSTAAAILVAVVLGAEIPVHFVGAAWMVFSVILLEIGARKSLFEFRAQAYALACGGGLAAAFLHTAPDPSQSWQPLSIALAVAYWYAIRFYRRRAAAMSEDEQFTVAVGGSLGTALLAALLLWRTVPEAWLGLAWCGLAAALFEIGNRSLPAQMRLMFWPTAALGALGLFETHHRDFIKFPLVEVWGSYLAAALAAWLVTARALVWRPANLGESERSVLIGTSAALGSVAFMSYLWLVLPEALVSVAWGALALVAVRIGRSMSAASIAWIGNAVMLGVLGRVLFVDLPSGEIDHRLIAVVPSIASLYLLSYWQTIDPGGSAMRLIARAQCWIASGVAVLLIASEAGTRQVGLGWIAFAVPLLAIGIRRRVLDLRLQGYIAGLLAFAAAMVANVSPPAVVLCSAVIAGLYLMQAITTRANLSEEERYAPLVSSILGTVLLTALLYGRVSGKLLTVACGLQGLSLLAAGFPLRQRILRLQGLVLLLVCVLKLFIYDLRSLETIYRILSFIALGVIMLGVSWIYTRFREHIRRYL